MYSVTDVTRSQRHMTELELTLVTRVLVMGVWDMKSQIYSGCRQGGDLSESYGMSAGLTHKDTGS